MGLLESAFFFHGMKRFAWMTPFRAEAQGHALNSNRASCAGRLGVVHKVESTYVRIKPEEILGS